MCWDRLIEIEEGAQTGKRVAEAAPARRPEPRPAVLLAPPKAAEPATSEPITAEVPELVETP